TNGKGSTAAFLASITMEAGYKTGLYTSPHLVRFTERIRINGAEIPEKRLVAYARALRPMIEKCRATFFEATTCIAFQYFADEGVDIAIIEAGLGGRLDSTNVLKPMVSVITNVGLDHTDILGRTIPAIAREKGGIIKKGVPCITAATDASTLRTLRGIAARKHTRLLRSQRVVSFGLHRTEASKVAFRSRAYSIPGVQLGLAGPHQRQNAQLAVAALEILRRNHEQRSSFERIDVSAIQRGLRNVVQNTGLHGRLERIGPEKRYILDVAHNPPGIRTLVDALRSGGMNDLVVVFGVMKDKDYRAMVAGLSRVSGILIPVAPEGERALSARKLFDYVRQQRIPVLPGGTVRQGLRSARKHCRPSQRILITGSHYVVGEALDYLCRKKA
ncbi:MAG: folylpolyglutamate synthase/dihydrofolate synthase family protein, partial [Bacteroidota bacterium]